MLAYPSLVMASIARREPSRRVSSPPVMGCMPRLPARRANSRAPHRLVSVRARAGYPNSTALDRSSWTWDAPIPKE